jgi:hypothetical protein
MIRKAYSKTGRACRVTFKIPAGQVSAEGGAVLGEFNDWRPEAHRFERLKDGSFSLTLSLPVGGQYRFRYLFDGSRWENDESADAYVPNRFGGEDAVLVLPPPAEADHGAGNGAKAGAGARSRGKTKTPGATAGKRPARRAAP